MRKSGFTLAEMMVSMGILTIVSLLGFIALRSSTEASSLALALAEVQGSLRDAMGAITSEARGAYTDRTVESPELLAPENAVRIEVTEGGAAIVFQVPVPTDGPDMVTASAPITIRFENEDLPGVGGEPNAVLDDGEDTNEDGRLTRRIVREQAGVQTVVGAANTISQAVFELLPNADAGNDTLTTLRVWMEATKRYGSGPGNIVRAQLESTVDLKN